METTTATPKQIAFVRRLVREREWPVAGQTEREAYIIARCEDALEAEQTRFLGRKEASEVIDWLLERPRKGDDKPQPEVGVYIFPDGRIVKTQPNKAGTNVYTKLWVSINGERLTLADTRQHGEWDYRPELKRELDAARKMTLDEAKEFILVYGQCVRCGRTLKAADSVERGIGPVCMNYFSF